MRAGPLRHMCTVQKAQQIPRPGGGFTESWLDLRKVWAEIAIPTGRVAAVADQLQTLISAEIRVRYRADFVAGMRLVHGRQTYLIGAALPDNDRTMLRLLCSNVVNS